MTEEKTAGPWTITIQGEGSYDNGHEKDIEARAEEFAAHLETAGHSVRSVRLAVGNEKTYQAGEWHHAHSPVVS
jgi:hypothetical protein